MRTFEIVVAADRNGGIGKNGALPWQLPGDMARFRQLTTAVRQAGKRNAVIMGRKTWESIPTRFRPLKDRLNIVLTRGAAAYADANTLIAANLQAALALCEQEQVETIFVIGGGAVYTEALQHPACEIVHLTRVDGAFECDSFLQLSEIERRFDHQKNLDSPMQEENGIRYTFQRHACKQKCGSASV